MNLKNPIIIHSALADSVLLLSHLLHQNLPSDIIPSAKSLQNLRWIGRFSECKKVPSKNQNQNPPYNPEPKMRVRVTHLSSIKDPLLPSALHPHSAGLSGLVLQCNEVHLITLHQDFERVRGQTKVQIC